jgi:hypothetical protein
MGRYHASIGVAPVSWRMLQNGMRNKVSSKQSLWFDIMFVFSLSLLRNDENSEK